jgi:DNA-binding beta-propeller fold protein YncE
MKLSLRILTSFVALAAVGLPCGAASQPTADYRITRTVPLGGPDRWDYVVFDAESGRVFVAHGDELTVVNGESGEIAGRIKGLPGGTHGIAVVKDSNRGYTDEGDTGKAVSFDLKTLAIQKHTQAAEDADAVAFDPVSHHVFVINGDTGSITVIDPKNDTAITTLEVGGKLEYAVPGENGKLFVNGAGKREVVVIDTASNQVTSRWPVPDCESPHGLAIDPGAHRLFVSCLNKRLSVVDSHSGKVVATLPIGAGSDAALFDAKRQLVFSSNGRDGTISVIWQQDPNTYVPLANIKTVESARTMGLNPATGRIYLAAAEIQPDGVPDNKTHRRPLVPGSLKLLFLDPVH